MSDFLIDLQSWIVFPFCLIPWIRRNPTLFSLFEQVNFPPTNSSRLSHLILLYISFSGSLCWLCTPLDSFYFCSHSFHFRTFRVSYVASCSFVVCSRKQVVVVVHKEEWKKNCSINGTQETKVVAEKDQQIEVSWKCKTYRIILWGL